MPTADYRPSEFGVYLRRLRESKHISLRDLGDMAGVPFTTINAWETGRRPPRQDRTRNPIIRVAQALGDDPLRLLQLAGLEPRDDVKTVRARPPFRELILTEKTLTPDQKAAFLALYDGFISGAVSPSKRR